ncbi:hypothetical protein Ae201684P_021863 [Aphanomyces euteiches]|uniref:Uncharacterized protein n=1 Tax=Aphanomyces euteiches TaxID=100861 RepID=A0A6G0WT07_9STRA|nr:hypothetical protein Ae201684_011994 [Aphanomyces euteiches]KAH9056126.1 hypothetical protein Ae201684P_021863 [Aphanomyces euteiches]
MYRGTSPSCAGDRGGVVVGVGGVVDGVETHIEAVRVNPSFPGEVFPGEEEELLRRTVARVGNDSKLKDMIKLSQLERSGRRSSGPARK